MGVRSRLMQDTLTYLKRQLESGSRHSLHDMPEGLDLEW